MVEPGRAVELDFAVFAELFREPLREAPRAIHDLLHVRDADAGWHDHLPLLYSFLALGAPRAAEPGRAEQADSRDVRGCLLGRRDHSRRLS